MMLSPKHRFCHDSYKTVSPASGSDQVCDITKMSRQQSVHNLTCHISHSGEEDDNDGNDYTGNNDNNNDNDIYNNDNATNTLVTFLTVTMTHFIKRWGLDFP